MQCRVGGQQTRRKHNAKVSQHLASAFQVVWRERDLDKPSHRATDATRNYDEDRQQCRVSRW